SAGRSPAYSEPSVGSKRTRTISPRRGLCVENTVHLRLQWFPFLRCFEIDVPHLLTTFCDVAAQGFSPAFHQPGGHQLRYNGTAPSRTDGFIELLQHIGRQRVRPFR